MDDLPDDLVEYIYKIYYKKIVLDELLKLEFPKMCLNCCYHGLPCANCYDYKYEGNLGPGYVLGEQFLYVDDISSNVLFNTIKWALRKPYKIFYSNSQISKHVNLPQHVFDL